MIFDERIRRERIDVDLMGIPGIEATRVPAKLDQLRELGASIVSAATPAELAAAMEAEFGVPAANTADTLRTFNATTDPIGELDPPRRRDHAPIEEAPLRAIACVSGITYTMGGLAVEPDMRVLDGVYAAGADAGNVFEDVYGGGLGWAAVSGRRAGRAAVAHAQRRVSGVVANSDIGSSSTPPAAPRFVVDGPAGARPRRLTHASVDLHNHRL